MEDLTKLKTSFVLMMISIFVTVFNLIMAIYGVFFHFTYLIVIILLVIVIIFNMSLETKYKVTYINIFAWFVIIIINLILICANL